MKMRPLHKKMLRGSISSSTSCTKKAAEGFSPSRRVFVKAAGGPAESQRVRVQEENKRREAGRAPLMAAGSLREEQGPGSPDPPPQPEKTAFPGRGQRSPLFALNPEVESGWSRHDSWWRRQRPTIHLRCKPLPAEEEE